MSERAWPERTSCPLSVLVFIALFAGTRLTLEQPIGAPSVLLEEPLVWWLLGALACGATLAVCVVSLQRAEHGMGAALGVRVSVVFGMCLAAACVGRALGRTILAREARDLDAMEAHAVSSWELIIERRPSPVEQGYWSSARVVIEGKSAGRVWVSSNDPLSLGTQLHAVGRFEPLGDDEWGVSSQTQGITGTVNIVSLIDAQPPTGLTALVEEAREFLLSGVSPEESPGRALVAASALGAREGIKRFGIDDLFSKIGLSHLIAVSGLHVALLLGLVGAALEHVRLKASVRVVALLLAGLAYVLLCGQPTSAIRSFAMVGASEIALLAGRRAWGLHALGLSAMAMVLVNPTSVGDLGFCLSVLCVAAISLVSPWLRAVLGLDGRIQGVSRRRWLKRAFVEAWRALKLQAALALLCTVVSAPLVAATYGDLSLMAPLAAVILVTPFEAFLALSMASAFLSWVPVFAGLLVTLAAVLGHLLLIVAEGLGRFPFAEVALEVAEPWATILPWTILLGFWLWWPRPTLERVGLFAGSAAAALCAWMLVRPLVQGARVVVLDVGQGDAILVQDGWDCALIDTGPDASVVSALAREGVLSLDAVILTHQHDDHAGGLPELAGKVRVGSILVPEGQREAMTQEGMAAARDLGAHVEELEAGTRVHVGDFTLTMLWPREPEDGDENDESLVLGLAFERRGASFTGLLTGDAEGDVLRSLLDDKLIGDVDFLKVGHHGSSASIDEEEAGELSAEVAVASAGEGNRYGHPKEECVEALTSQGSLFLCTKDVGSVEIRPGADGPRVRCERAQAASLG